MYPPFLAAPAKQAKQQKQEAAQNSQMQDAKEVLQKLANYQEARQIFTPEPWYESRKENNLYVGAVGGLNYTTSQTGGMSVSYNAGSVTN